MNNRDRTEGEQLVAEAREQLSRRGRLNKGTRSQLVQFLIRAAADSDPGEIGEQHGAISPPISEWSQEDYDAFRASGQLD